MCFIFQCMYFCDSIMVVMSANAREQKKKQRLLQDLELIMAKLHIIIDIYTDYDCIFQ